MKAEEVRKMEFEIDLERLAEAVLKSGEREAYRLVSEGTNHRIGLTLTIAEDGNRIWSIELLLRVFNNDSSLEFSTLERFLQLSHEIEQMGYKMTPPDDGWMSCEKKLYSADVVPECAAVMRAITRHIPQRPATRENGKEGAE